MNTQNKIEQKREYDQNWKREQRLKNPEKVRAYGRLKYKKNKDDPEKSERRKEYMRAYRKVWEKNNPARLAYRREWMRNWNKKNAKEIYEKRRKRPYEKIAATIRSRIYDYLKHGYKTDKTEVLLGITMKELQVYLEKQFKDGMSWENYGFYGWHVDHIIPLSSFDLTIEEEQKKAFHYTNLQPLWAKENMSKGSKVF
jgi:hypothetical protein